MRMSDEGISRRTAENTKKELGIRSYRKMRQWYWSIQPEVKQMDGYVSMGILTGKAPGTGAD